MQSVQTWSQPLPQLAPLSPLGTRKAPSRWGPGAGRALRLQLFPVCNEQPPGRPWEPPALQPCTQLQLPASPVPHHSEGTVTCQLSPAAPGPAKACVVPSVSD